MARWEADPSADMVRRLGKSSLELGNTTSNGSCPDIWELDNGDIAVIGRNATEAYTGRLPDGVSVHDDERVVIVPRNAFIAASPDISSLS